MSSFISFRYFTSNSPLHRSSPTDKTVWLALIIAQAIGFSSIYLSVFAIVAVLAIGHFLGGVRLKHLKPVGLIVVFTILLSIFLGVTTPPTAWQRLLPGTHMFYPTVFGAGQFYFSIDGIGRGFTVGSRIMIVLLAGIVYSCTTNPRDIMGSFVRMHMNYRFAYASAMGVTLIPVYQDMANAIGVALKIRGYVGGSPLRRLRSWMRFTFLLLAGTLRKAEKMGIAMENKAFGAYQTRTTIRQVSFNSNAAKILSVAWVLVILVGVTLLAFHLLI